MHISSCTALVLLALLVLPGAPLRAARKDAAPAVPQATHTNASRTLRFKTPADWTVESRPGEPELTEARGGGLLLRIVRRQGELGLDAVHVDCMSSRIEPSENERPGSEYEYDFLGGTAGERRVLDSAFVVSYDQPVAGSKRWRQRNLTLVGAGESVCVIGYAPAEAWKKSKQLRSLLDSVIASLEFAPWP